jgi:hypothetical protein
MATAPPRTTAWGAPRSEPGRSPTSAPSSWRRQFLAAIVEPLPPIPCGDCFGACWSPLSIPFCSSPLPRGPVDGDGGGFVGAVSVALREQRCRHWRRASVSGIGAQPPLSVAGRSLLHCARLLRSSCGMINAADSNFHQKKNCSPCSTRL